MLFFKLLTSIGILAFAIGGIAKAAFNAWWGIVVLFPLLIIMHYGVVLREERYLEQKFGEPNRKYPSTVRRYI